MLRDILGQAWDSAMVYNRRRTAITWSAWPGASPPWCCGCLWRPVSPMPSRTIFAEFGTNTIIFWGGRTLSRPAAIRRGGAALRFTLDDLARVSNSVPGISYFPYATRMFPCRRSPT